MIDYGLKGKKALVTGNSRGIGLSVSAALMNFGTKANFVISRSTGYDLMTDEGLNKLFEKIKSPDIIICNLGGMGTSSIEDMEDVMKKNFFINVKIVDHYLPGMVERKWGRIVFISSIYGKEKGINPIFTAAKASQIAYAKSIAGKYEGVTVNTICPGYIKTKSKIEEYAKEVKAPVGCPEDISNAVVFLCSEQAKFINGACLVIDGGFTKSF